jgi:hypothetical protein
MCVNEKRRLPALAFAPSRQTGGCGVGVDVGVGWVGVGVGWVGVGCGWVDVGAVGWVGVGVGVR